MKNDWTQEDRINRLRAEVSARGRDIANLLEQIEAKDLEIAALKVERDKYRAERCNWEVREVLKDLVDYAPRRNWEEK